MRELVRIKPSSQAFELRRFALEIGAAVPTPGSLHHFRGTSVLLSTAKLKR
jgi:hypothetical protein